MKTIYLAIITVLALAVIMAVSPTIRDYWIGMASGLFSIISSCMPHGSTYGLNC